MNHNFLRDVAIALVGDPAVPCTQAEIEVAAGTNLLDALSIRWVYDFCARFKSTENIAEEHKTATPVGDYSKSQQQLSYFWSIR